MKQVGALAVLLGCIVGANWALARFGLVPIGFGLMAPAGVFFAGVTFTARDVVRETSGRRGVAMAIALGALLSAFVEGAQGFAVASGVAFAVSETADALVYEPIREVTRTGAVVASNTVGAVIDSALFLWLAFGSIDFIAGQVLGKTYMTALAVAGMWAWRVVSVRRAQAHS